MQEKKYPETIKKYIDDRRMMLSDESLSEDFTFDFKQAKLLVKKIKNIRFMKENKSDYKDLSIKEMTDKEFSNFLRWKEEIVYGEMGCNPTEECLVGMWEMWKHLHKPIDEDELDDLSYDV